MTEVYSLEQIKSVLKDIDAVSAVEQGFAFYSQGRCVIPPVGEMIFEKPPGDVHIKYGYIKNDDFYVIKIASGFTQNEKRGLPSGNGLMLVFDKKTGEPLCILCDRGLLTDIRTAAAGAVCAKYLAPKNIGRIGIIGAGTQGRLQLEYLKSIAGCRDVLVWGMSKKELDAYKQDMEPKGFRVETTLQTEEVAETCRLIVTATPAASPLLHKEHIRNGTHITAVGADTPRKNELDPEILAEADIVVADSLEQCRLRGEIFHALQKGYIQEKNIRELGRVILGKEPGRSSDEQLTVTDLTGVAVQDIQISTAVFQALRLKNST